MPHYSFKCPNCNKEYDFKWSFKQHDEYKHTVKCVDCENERLVQMVESSNFVLKGYGWFKPNELTHGIDPYSISNSEIAKSDSEAMRADDNVQNMMLKHSDSGDE